MKSGYLVLALATACAADATSPGGNGMAGTSAGGTSGGGTGQGGAFVPNTGNVGNVGTGNTGNVPNGGTGNVGTGGTGNVGTGNTGNVGTGGTGATSTGGTGAIGNGGAGGTITQSCSNLPAMPDNPGDRGPWEVGVRTVNVGRTKAEIVYPAEPGSTDGLEYATYDIRDWLPAGEFTKVPDDASPQVTALNGGLYRDVPIDSEYGPYPVIIMIHGTSSVRIASGSINAHWASRGFVVIAADYPGLGLHDKLAENPECSALGYTVTGLQDVPTDVNDQIAALTAASGEFAFLSGRIDMTRLALAGHSQGACIAAQLATLPNVHSVVALTGSTVVSSGPDLDNIMYYAGMSDTVMPYTDATAIGGVGNLVCALGISNTSGYNGSPGPPAVKKRLVGVTGGGHLLPTDLCQTNQYGLNAVEEALQDGVCGIAGAVFVGLPLIFDCGALDWARGNEVTWHATTLALEESLHCMDRSARFSTLQSDVPEIGELQEAL